MATLLPSPSLWQCQPMSQVPKSTAVQVGNTKITQTSDLSLFLAHSLAGSLAKQKIEDSLIVVLLWL